jgi:hypothetical protein
MTPQELRTALLFILGITVVNFLMLAYDTSQIYGFSHFMRAILGG